VIEGRKYFPRGPHVLLALLYDILGRLELCLSGRTENKPRKFGRVNWFGFRASMEHKTFRIRCTQHRNVAACQLYNHLLSTPVPYDCCCLVAILRIPLPPVFPNVPSLFPSLLPPYAATHHCAPYHVLDNVRFTKLSSRGIHRTSIVS